jgi:IclR helix-turn-helix domain
MTKQILILGLDRDARRTLLALYELSARDRSTIPGRSRAEPRASTAGRARLDLAALARQLGLPPSHVFATLHALDARGLVWAARCRLTLRGLASAARLAALRARANAHGRAA